VQINVPAEKIDLGNWLTELTDAEYQACAVPDHHACGWSKNANNDSVSINVEVIGGTLMIQHYIAEVQEPHHRRLVSISESQSPNGWQYMKVTWDLSVAPLDSGRATFTNRVQSWPTRALLEGLKEGGIPFEQVARDRQAAVGRHNAIEVRGYGAGIERAATRA
jgi:hypothetical protein